MELESHSPEHIHVDYPYFHIRFPNRAEPREEDLRIIYDDTPGEWHRSGYSNFRATSGTMSSHPVSLSFEQEIQQLSTEHLSNSFLYPKSVSDSKISDGHDNRVPISPVRKPPSNTY